MKIKKQLPLFFFFLSHILTGERNYYPKLKNSTVKSKRKGNLINIKDNKIELGGCVDCPDRLANLLRKQKNKR